MNITGKARVYNMEVKEKFCKCSLQVGKKKKDDTWENMWFQAKFVGPCQSECQTMNKGDTINITSGVLESWQNDKKITFTTIVIFEFEVVKKASGESQPHVDNGICPDCKQPLENCECTLPF